ncbi:hypothetical protein GH714_011420 [Hevea brasiliensis]|uniref:Exocyst subunit Exo70 family protein n=1 Tax=Hevea brasiliensis TaxID=3981 RepID=A0A6A6NGH4_HEVBR|nr:hypothetical protein GH714_011420 [Hevea brasiliensis]
MASQEEELTLKLELACSDLKTVLQTSTKMEDSLEKMDKSPRNKNQQSGLSSLALLDCFKLSESLQRKILEVSSKLSAEEKPKKRLKLLLRYVDCVDKLNAAINAISQDGEPVIQKLQEVVEFLSRTKATDQYRTHRLRQALVTLKALFESEVDAMKFDGLLDEALLILQDQYESILHQVKHQNIGESQEEDGAEIGPTSDLGTELEIEILRRISETLAANDCLDICIDIYIKVRYRKAAKALMRLNPDYLRTYTPEEIDEMEWENLEIAISLWIQHFELAVKTVFQSEKKLSNQILGGIMDGVVWLECFVKIADKIMAVFFRFGEGVARSSKEPQKLFTLLDMFDSLEKLQTEFSEIFESEAGADICTRFRELEKLLIHASSKVFWEFGLLIEGNSDGFPPQQDSSVPKLVRYAINYLKYLAAENYSAPLAKVLRTEHIWKAGIFSKPETDENLVNDAISNIMEALKRNVESKRSRYKDKVVPNVFAMNTYWYIYMRTRNTELGKLLGEQYMKQNYKAVAEESAYIYQRQAWGRLRHGGSYYAIPDDDLRGQIGEATVKLLVPAYTKFLEVYGPGLELGGESCVSPESIKGVLAQIFNGGHRVDEGKLKRRDIKDLTSGTTSMSGR